MPRRFIIVMFIFVGVLTFAGVVIFASSAKQSSPVPSSIDTVSLPTPETGWSTYWNTKYGFTLKYPSDFVLTTDIGPLQEDISQPFWEDDTNEIIIQRIFIPSSTTSENRLPESLDLHVHDATDSSTDEYDDPVGFWSDPLETLIPKIRMLAEAGKDEPIGPVLTMTLASQTAYEFAVNKGVGLNGFGEAIDEQYLWAFLGTRSAVLEVSLPNSPMFRQILQTIQLTSQGPGLD